MFSTFHAGINKVLSFLTLTYLIGQRYQSDRSQELTQSLRLVFTGDGVVVGVVIRSLERYDLVKIKPTESEAEH